MDTFDINGNWTQTLNASITQTQATVELSLDSGETTQGTLIPNLLLYPVDATDYVLLGCEIQGQHLTLYLENNESLQAMTPSGNILFTKG